MVGVETEEHVVSGADAGAGECEVVEDVTAAVEGGREERRNGWE